MSPFFQFQEKHENPNFPDVWDVNPQAVLAAKDQLCLIDVRQPEEYNDQLGHIAGTQLVVLDTLPLDIESLPKDKTLVFVCRSGGRSARAAHYVTSKGFKSVFNMQGGMLLWNQLGLPVERQS